jgi:Domain of unknown function (DUF5666)
MRRRHSVLLAVLAALLAAACGDDSPTSDQAALTEGSGGLVEFAGGIDAITADSLTVAGRTFVVDSSTVTLREGTAISFSLLKLDDFVVIKASQNRNGVWTAREIRLRVGTAVSEIKLTGRVDSVSPPNLVVSGRVVTVIASTEFTGLGDPRSLNDIRPGYTVTVTGIDQGDSLLALKIRLEAK